MPYYQDLTQHVHFIEDVKYENLLPEGSIQISDAEAAILTAPVPKTPTSAELLAETDQYMSRITEDTVVNLLLKGTVTKGDYPQIVWDRINYRRSLRNQQPI